MLGNALHHLIVPGNTLDHLIMPVTHATHVTRYTPQVSNLMRKLAPLNYSASAPATLREQELQLQQVGTGDPLSDLELNARPGSGRVILEDDISQAASGKRGRCVRRARRERFHVSRSRLCVKISSTSAHYVQLPS